MPSEVPKCVSCKNILSYFLFAVGVLVFAVHFFIKTLYTTITLTFCKQKVKFESI